MRSEISNFMADGYSFLGKRQEFASSCDELRAFIGGVVGTHQPGRTLFVNEVDSYLWHKFLSKIFANEAVNNFLSGLERTFREPVYLMPDFELMYNYKFKREEKRMEGWHRDAGGEYKYPYCREILRSPNYCFGKLGIYFQSNDPIAGGGIDVISKSHKRNLKIATGFNLFKTVSASLPRYASKIPYNLQMKILGAERLDLKCGDILVFDSRILHRGSPTLSATLTQDGLDKIVCYIQFGSEPALASYLFDRLKRNGDHETKNWAAQLNHLLNNGIKHQKLMPFAMLQRMLKN